METNKMNTTQANETLQDEFGKFPFTVTSQWTLLDGQWIKFYTIYNANGEPVNTLPRTKEELVEYTKIFLSLLETL